LSVTYLGVRHHGPGSARAVERALEALAPDCVLIEGPPEGSELISACLKEGLTPPVSILAYSAKHSGVSSFWPYCEFSPEWVAMRYASERGLTCAFVDLPVRHQLAFTIEARDRAESANERAGSVEERATLGALDDAQASAPPQGDESAPLHPRVAWAYELRRDPLGYLATLSREGEVELGDERGEGWWEELIEGRGELSGEEALAFFESVAEVMQVMRDELDEVQRHTGPLPGGPFVGVARERLREASMRRLIKKHSRGHERVAVICGAWHVPALKAKVKASEDSALLKGLPKEKVTCLWVPWSEARLAHDKGYAAGLSAPAWSRYLWRYPQREELTERWLIDAVRLLRAEGFSASSAHVIEATRLASALASLRARPAPDLSDLQDALSSTLSLKDQRPLALVQAQLISGTLMGQVPSDELNHPIVRDFERENKRLRLKLSDQPSTTRLDLRKALHQDKSAYLHRLGLLNIPWGSANARGGSGLKGTALEEWTLAWEPEWMMRLIDAGGYGDSVKGAASELVTQRATRGYGRHEPPLKSHERGAAGGLGLTALTGLLWRCLRAQLSDPLPSLLKAIGDEASLTRSLDELLDAVPELIWMVRYQQSGVTGLELSQLPEVTRQLLPRIFSGLPDASVQLSEELTIALCARISSLHRALMTSGDQPYLYEHKEAWRACLERVMDRAQSEPRVRGLITRTLLEQGWWSEALVYAHARRSLSAREEPARCIAWLEGFLTGGGLLLIYHDTLRALVDRWVCSLSEEDLITLLPLLRRAFTSFSYEENRQLEATLARDELRSPHARPRAQQSSSPAPSPTIAGLELTPGRARYLERAMSWLTEPSDPLPEHVKITSTPQQETR